MATILVIEDSQDNFDLLEDAIDGAHELVHATDGASGLAHAARRPPDLILMDMGLPELDGWSVVKRAKAVPDLARVPIVALTAHAMAGDRERCLAAGCDDYLPKPVNIRQLMNLLDHWLGVTAEATDAPSAQS
jgi:CheY-like chemotaxis protein